MCNNSLTTEKYIDSKNHDVEMYYYLAVDGGHSNNTCEDTHDLIWTDFEKVEGTLSYPSLKAVWAEVKDRVYKVIE